MQAEQLKYNAKSIFSGNLYKNYQWFNANFFTNIEAASREFLNTDIGLKFISVSEKENILFAGEDYFVTKIRITKDYNILLRISKTAIEILLKQVLGETEKKFELEDLTELEAKIITSFNDFIYKSFTNNLIDINKLSKKTKKCNDCHLTFFVKNESMDLGKIIVSIPLNALPEIPQSDPVYTFGLDHFPKTQVAVDIEVGTTRISLSDVKHMEVGDIVVLEKSNINKMMITVGNQRKVFKLTPDPSLIISMDDHDDSHENGGKIMEEITTQNMWDSIQVDISAEFEQVKIPLGDLRQISEGLVVDIGSVYENKIDLMVENKIIASGELVIINDRYGVRVDTVYNNESQQSTAAQSSKEVEEEEISEPIEDEFNEDDFDYSNFDIEDENI